MRKITEVVEDFLACEGRADIAGVRGALADDFVFESPFNVQGTASRVEGADVWCGYLSKYIAPEAGHYSDWRFSEIKIYPVEGGRIVFAEWKCDAIVAGTGEPYHNEYVGYFEIENEKITLFREYRNPMSTAKALSSSQA